MKEGEADAQDRKCGTCKWHNGRTLAGRGGRAVARICTNPLSGLEGMFLGVALPACKRWKEAVRNDEGAAADL